MTESFLSYLVDATDLIIEVNDAWTGFALANEGAHLLAPAVLGRPLWDMVSDVPTRQVYEHLLRRARQGNQPVEFCFRCDGPTHRRLLRMRLTATTESGVRFETQLLKEEVRPSVALLDVRAERSGDVIRICGWCMRVPVVTGEWLELEEAVPLFQIFERSPLPRLSHCMCPDCHSLMMGTVDGTEAVLQDSPW